MLFVITASVLNIYFRRCAIWVRRRRSHPQRHHDAQPYDNGYSPAFTKRQMTSAQSYHERKHYIPHRKSPMDDDKEKMQVSEDLVQE